MLKSIGILKLLVLLQILDEELLSLKPEEDSRLGQLIDQRRRLIAEMCKEDSSIYSGSIDVVISWIRENRLVIEF